MNGWNLKNVPQKGKGNDIDPNHEFFFGVPAFQLTPGVYIVDVSSSQVAICSLASGIGEASLLAMASFYEAKAWWVDLRRWRSFFWGEALFWTTRAPVSSTFLTCWSTFEVVIIPICFGRYSKWRQKFYDMKIVRCIMIYIYDTFNSQQNQENQVNSSPTTDLWKNPSNVFCRTMAHQLPALLGCLVFGYGLCWYCWLCLVFGLRISWYMFSGKGRFLMIWWGGLFNMTWWHLGEMSLEGSYFKWNVKNLASTKEAPMTQQQLQVDVGWNPFFF